MIIGIDLGTTYSVSAYVNESGIPEIISNNEGNTTTPSVVLFDDEKNIVVGECAKDSSVIRPKDVVPVVKNYMGKREILKEYNNQKYTPEMISSFILRKVIQDSAERLGKEIEGVVVTVPAYFTDAQRKSTEDAVRMSGVRLVAMINEPTAAALCYIKKYSVQDENILIYDLGGGTFDVTILRVRNGKNIDVLATGGLSNAGGRFFDQYIVDYVVEYINEKYDIDLEDDEYLDELQELYIKAENAKIQLSSKNVTKIVLKIGKIKEQIEITRDLFDDMIGKIYRRTENKVKEVIKEAACEKKDIDKVLLVGGSSRIPYVVSSIKEFMEKEPSKEINPDEAVAMGAALYAEMNVSEMNTTVFTDVCSHSIGVVVINDEGQEENEIVIPRNSKIPIEKEQRFRTIVKNQQAISITVTEGEFKELSDVTILGEFDIDIPSGLEENELVLVSINLDRFQLMHINIKLPKIGFSREYSLKRAANMSIESVKKVTGILRDYKVS